jgi:hypothetical protein
MQNSAVCGKMLWGVGDFDSAQSPSVIALYSFLLLLVGCSDRCEFKVDLLSVRVGIVNR